MPFSPMALDFSPGIQRDGTELDGKSCVDGQWCRFQRGKPRKMGGYKALSQNMGHISRALHMQSSGGYSYVHSGHSNGIEFYQIDANGNSSVPADRTPAGYVAGATNTWQLSAYFDPNSSSQQMLAFSVPALGDITTRASGSLYAGPVYSTAALTSVANVLPDVSGGIVVLPPYTVLYGNDGLVQWSVPASPLDYAGQGSGAARVTHQKIVRALPVRGGGTFSPGALLWSLDALIRMYFIGNPAVFAFDQLSDNSSILSHNCVVDVEGTYYWVGADRFLRYNGVTQEVPNDKNQNFFFDNINRPYAQKAFAVRNTRYGEIWFCAPLFNATEPNWAVIYNYRENTWYDTQLPNTGRSFGIQQDVTQGPLMSGVVQGSNNLYRLWGHEFGTDEVDGANTSAVPSSFTSPVLTAANFQQPLDKGIHIDAIETDFVQANALSVTAFTRGTARSPYIAQATETINQGAAGPLDQYTPLRVTGKQIKLKFASNAAGSDYQAGKLLAYVETDTARRTQ